MERERERGERGERGRKRGEREREGREGERGGEREREGREGERGERGRERGRRERRMQLTFQCVSLLHWVQPDRLSTHHDNTTMHRLVLVQLPHGLCSLQVL